MHHKLILIIVIFSFLLASPVSGEEFEINPRLIDQFRITSEEIGTIGHWSMGGYLIRESDAMVLTRVALGEAPHCLQDQIYIMWNIRMRAELGYKNYNKGDASYKIDRWGAPTSIQMEALCVGGCQYAIVRVVENIIYPNIAEPAILRLMLYPDDDQLEEFYTAYVEAQKILAVPLIMMPKELIGYDGFLSTNISDEGFSDWKPNGNNRRQLSSCGGNVWNDKYKEDNRWFGLHDLYPLTNDEEYDIIGP